VVAIDGKALCGMRESGKMTLVHVVSAGAEDSGLVLAPPLPVRVPIYFEMFPATGEQVRAMARAIRHRAGAYMRRPAKTELRFCFPAAVNTTGLGGAACSSTLFASN
jgi:hypothetical protein